MSRGSLFALAVLVMVYLLRVGVRKRVLVWITLIPLLVVFLPHDFFARVQRGASDRGTGRFDIWIVAVHIIKHYPIFGTGLENFRTAYNQFAGYAPVFRRFDRDPHNVYLQVWAETGVVGLILLITAVGSQLKAVRASRSENKGTADCSGGCVLGVIDSRVGSQHPLAKVLLDVIRFLGHLHRKCGQSWLDRSK